MFNCFSLVARYITVFSFCSLLLTTAACHKEPEPSPQAKSTTNTTLISLKKAQEIFNSTVNSAVYTSRIETSPYKEINILWHEAKIGKFDNGDKYIKFCTEFKINTKRYTPNKFKRKILLPNPELYIIQGSNDNYSMLFREILPSYNHKSNNNFSGNVYFKNIYGDLIRGYVFEEGVKKKKISSIKNIVTDNSLQNREYCTVCYDETYHQMCYDSRGHHVQSISYTYQGCQTFHMPGDPYGGDDLYRCSPLTIVSQNTWSSCVYFPDPSDPGDGGTPYDPTGSSAGQAASFDASIDDQGLQPCMTTILAQIKGISTGQIGFIIQGFAGQIPGYNWKLQNGNLSPNTYGLTIMDPTHTHVLTTFNSGLFANASDLSVARTIMHESVHAYLVASFYYDQTLARAAYPDIVQAYFAKKHPDMNTIHHDEMVKGFVQQIAHGLQQYGVQRGYNLPNEFYVNMAWGGLEGTRAFNSLNSSQKEQIRNTILIELTGKDLDDNSVSQQGHPSGC